MEKKMKCSACEKEIDKLRMGDYRYGSPFQNCPHCGKEYVDKRYHEVVVDGYYVGHRLFVPAWQIAGTMVSIMMFAFAMSYLSAWYFGERGMIILFATSVFLFTLFACMEMSALIKYPARMAKLKEAKEESILRLSNEGYKEKLESIGMKVREEYL